MKYHDEVLSSFCDLLYAKGECHKYHLNEFLDNSKIKFTEAERILFIDGIYKNEFFSFVFDEGGPFVTDIAYLSKFGISQMIEHGSYLLYLKHKSKILDAEKLKIKKKERTDIRESWRKRNWLLMSVLSAISATTLTIIATWVENKISAKGAIPAPTIQEEQYTYWKYKHDSLIFEIYLRDSLIRKIDSSLTSIKK